MKTKLCLVLAVVLVVVGCAQLQEEIQRTREARRQRKVELARLRTGNPELTHDDVKDGYTYSVTLPWYIEKGSDEEIEYLRKLRKEEEAEAKARREFAEWKAQEEAKEKRRPEQHEAALQKQPTKAGFQNYVQLRDARVRLCERQGELTELHYNEAIQELLATRFIGSGLVIDVEKQELSLVDALSLHGHAPPLAYEIYVDLEPNFNQTWLLNGPTTVTLIVPKQVALGVNKNQQIRFEGKIKKYVVWEGEELSVTLYDVEITEVRE